MPALIPTAAPRAPAGPTIVLLPGLACDAALWRDIAPALAADHRVAVSDVHARFDDLPSMAGAVLAEHPGPLVLVGASMGGMVALEAEALARAAGGGERLRGLALLGSTARADTAEQRALRQAAIELFEAGRLHEVLVANLGFVFGARAARDAALVSDYLAMVHRAGAAQLVRQNRAVLARAARLPGLAGARCPVLAVGGAEDRLTPPDCSAEIAAAAPRGELHVIEQCGHLLTWEAPQRVVDRVTSWLAALPADA